MTIQRTTVSALSVGLMLLTAGRAPADQGKDARQAQLRLPITGTMAAGGTFSGTLSIQKFAARDGHVVAIGMVSGSLTSALGAPMGTALVGPIAFPVQVGPGATAGDALATAAAAQPQQAQACDVLHIDIGAVNLDVLGLQVSTQPIGIDLSGVSGGTNVLGTLICTILETLTNVVGLVNLLNQLLGLLGGLTGGLGL